MEQASQEGTKGTQFPKRNASAAYCTLEQSWLYLTGCNADTYKLSVSVSDYVVNVSVSIP